MLGGEERASLRRRGWAVGGGHSPTDSRGHVAWAGQAIKLDFLK